MPTEIERKFLPRDDSWRESVDRHERIIQGYLANTGKSSIRVRMTEAGADINIKSMTLGIARAEYEYPVPLDEAEIILETLCMRPLIRKTRYFIKAGRHTWEIDVFEGENAGLVIAEIELEASDEAFDPPAWLGREISDDPRYYNMSLVDKPYSAW